MYVLLVVAIVVFGVFVWLKQPQYVAPECDAGSESALYHDGQFSNPVAPAPVSSGRSRSVLAMWYRFLFLKPKDAIPQQALPSVKVDLHALSLTDNVIIWMGHSSYFCQVDGYRFLVDPVFSDEASPVPGTNRAFKGSNVYHAIDIPEIDYLLITHDHWDHLDYPTVSQLCDKIRHVVTPTGVGSYFRKWGFPESVITEGEWFSTVEQGDLTLHILPSQHFSGRLFKRNPTLWGSFAIITPHHRLYFGGDSGYGPHFQEIYQRVGAFDISVLECGQYDDDWPRIHMTPEQTARAASDLHSTALLPSHNSKFKLAHHAWYEPLERISAASRHHSWRLKTPRIGERINIDDPQQVFTDWWRSQ